MAKTNKKKDKEESKDPREKLKDEMIQKYGQDVFGVIENIGGHPTGIPPLDRALGTGGFPRGRVVEIFGPESGGKTLVSLVAVATAQREEKKPSAYFDLEYTFEKKWAKLLGLDLDMLDPYGKDTAEENLDIIGDLARSDVYAYIVVDSLVGLVPKKVVETPSMKKGEAMAEHAKIMKRGLLKIVPLLAKTDTCLIFINHLLHKVGVVYGNPEDTPGGKTLKFYASQRLRVSKKSKSNVEEGGEVIGHSVKIKVVKNKLGPPMRIADFPIIYTRGVDKDLLIAREAVEIGAVEKEGNTYYFDGEKIAVGAADYLETLSDDLALFEEISVKVNEKVQEG